MIKFMNEPVRKHKISDISAIGLDVFFLIFRKAKYVTEECTWAKASSEKRRWSTGYVIKKTKYTSYDKAAFMFHFFPFNR